MSVDIVFVDTEGKQYELDCGYCQLDDAAKSLLDYDAIGSFVQQHCRGRTIKVKEIRLVFEEPDEHGPAEA